MPIRPENRARYPKDWKAISLAELISPAALEARATLLSEVGHDVCMAPAFWEAWVAVVTGGSITPQKCDHDVLITGRADLAVEVKFSRSFYAAFGAYGRSVFKWSMTTPQMARANTDAVVLLGLHDEHLSAWVCSPLDVRGSMTMTVPATRAQTGPGSRYDAFAAPASDLLPAIIRVARAARSVGELFEAGAA